MSATFTDDDVEKPVVNGAGEEVGVVASVEGDVAHVRPSVDAVDSIKSSIGWEAVADRTEPLDAESVREITAEAVRLEGDLPMGGEESVEASETDPTAQGDDDAAPETEPAGGSAGIEETEVAEDLRDDTGEETLEETDAIDAEEQTGDRDPDRETERRDRGMEADPTELVDEGGDPGSRTGVSVDPSEKRELTDAAVDPDADREGTDAAVDPEGEFRSTDAAVDATDEPRRTDAAVDPGEQPRRSDPDPDTERDRDGVSDPDPADSGPTTEDAREADLEDGPEERRLKDVDDEADAESDESER